MDEEITNQNGESAASGKAGDELKEKLEQCEKQKNEYLGGWQRAKADFINYKKEEVRRMEELMRYGNEDLMRELVVTLDNFDLGIRTLEKSGPVEKGIYIIRSQIEDVLKKRGLEKITIQSGEPFNPSTAEAIAEVESDKPPGTILEEIEPGYKLYDKIIRPARVKVSRGT